MRITRSAMLLLFGLLPAACVTPPPSHTVSMPGVNITFGGDIDVWAINIAQWAFADPTRIAARPAEAARAAAALEYLVVALNAPRWAGMNPITKMEMLTARAELRQTLGVPPDAPSQAVIQALLDCANALAAGDPVTATATLRSPLFTFGPERTLAILNAMPFLRAANIATMHAGTTNTDGSGTIWRW